MARLLYGAQARSDIASIHVYITERNPAAARRVVAAIRHTAGLLAENPLLGRPDQQGLGRVAVVPRFGYLIFYRVEGETVEIRYILHPSRNR